MSNAPLFIDGIDNLSLVDGVIRYDLVSVGKIVDGKPVPERVGSVALSLQAFLRTHRQMTLSIERMVEQGILKKNEQPKDGPEGAKLN
jgi:hypothetical protein